jgi:hypothetical protein
MTNLFTAEQRRSTMERICDLLRKDDRIEGVVLVGSMARDPDHWSDVDLEVVVSKQENQDAVAADWVARMYEELSTLHHYEVAFGNTSVRGFLLDNLLEIDLSFTSVTAFRVWGPATLVFDRGNALQAAIDTPSPLEPTYPDWSAEAGFAWHDIVHAGISVKRGRLWQGLWYLERVRNRTLTLSSERRGWYADFFDYVDDLPAVEREPHEAALVPSLDPVHLLRAIRLATSLFIFELQKSDPTLAGKLERPLLSFVDAIAST